MFRSAKESSGKDTGISFVSVARESRHWTSAESSLGDNNNYDCSSLLLTQPSFPITMLKVYESILNRKE